MKRFTQFIAAPALGLALFDITFNHQNFTRTLRSIQAGMQIIYYYKFLYTGFNVDEIHSKTAQLILDTCRRNGGLYIKMGQGIASMNHILPRQYNDCLSKLQDDAPTISEKAVNKIFKEEFNKLPDEIFSYFNPEPVASASIAQVHYAVLKNGDKVAVKVQKPYIIHQFPYDMFCYALLLFSFEKIFSLPLFWSYDYTKQQLAKEVDFINEAQNAERVDEMFKNNSEIYVPKVYWDHTSARIMTAEWIDGFSLKDSAQIEAHNFSRKDIMKTIINCFGYQIFEGGLVHCDPHPGNILIRKHPTRNSVWGSNYHQIVLLDHGLYIEETPEFRKQYSQFWKSLLIQDFDAMEAVAAEWGIMDTELFTSLSIMKPYRSKQNISEVVTQKDLLQMQVDAKERVKSLLRDTKLIPREFIFVGRCMNLLRSNNKELGSPVNRVEMLARTALKGCDMTLVETIKVNTVIFGIQLTFYAVMILNLFKRLIGKKEENYEELMDNAMQKQLEEFGFRYELDS